MIRVIGRRVALILLTLWLISLLVFFLAQVVPGDIGRTVLGPFATPEQLASLEAELGLDRPLPVRYVEWLGGFVVGDWGNSLALQVPIRGLVLDRLLNSAQLAAVALILIIPLSILSGVLGGLREDGPFDRITRLTGLALTTVPLFVSGVFVLVIFAINLNWFPVSARVPEGASLLEALHHLILPSIPLMLTLFAYVAAMARAGTISVMDSAYVRTAFLKGLSRRQVVTRHVLRNALLPTITVIATQIGWLVGGLVVIETLFDYPGIGKLLLDSATKHDLPVLQATTLVVGLVYMLSNFAADVIYGILNPRIRLHDA